MVITLEHKLSKEPVSVQSIKLYVYVGASGGVMVNKLD